MNIAKYVLAVARIRKDAEKMTKDQVRELILFLEEDLRKKK